PRSGLVPAVDALRRSLVRSRGHVGPGSGRGGDSGLRPALAPDLQELRGLRGAGARRGRHRSAGPRPAGGGRGTGMSRGFAHLHLHSQYSLLDGANRLDDVIAAARSAGMPALALTDHGNLFGAIEFHDRARKAGIRPILGIEAYVAQGSHTERDPQRGSSNHLVLLARDATGWRNLVK